MDTCPICHDTHRYKYMHCKVCGNPHAYGGVSDIIRFIKYPENLCNTCADWCGIRPKIIEVLRG
jgi:CRISPR/Cas system-associated protein Cas10 (large subunit of type III CRISPR-Cas system)